MLSCHQFDDLLAYVDDAIVIVGLHGPGLALSVFAPSRGSCLVEIMPQKEASYLYESVRSYGLDYVRVKLSANPAQWFMHSRLVLSASDLRVIESTITEKVLSGRQLVAEFR